MSIENPTPTQQYVLDLLESEPGMSNADIAEETGTHTALVRDLRKAKRAAAESDDDDQGPGKLSSRKRVLDELSGTQAAALQRAAEDPDISNAELAEELGVHIATVRDARGDYEDAIEGIDLTPDDDAEPAAADTGTAEPATAEGGLDSGTIVAVLVGVLLLVAVVLLLV